MTSNLTVLYGFIYFVLCFAAGITSFDLTATVTSPSGVTEDATIEEVEDGLYAVHFIPKELGVHTVSVKYKEIHIPGESFYIFSKKNLKARTIFLFRAEKNQRIFN